LNSSLKDSNGDNNGYVLSLNYGDLKTWRLGTYGIFAKYYDQPRGTYIEHGMNGAGGRMQGFKGFGLGTNYTIAENFIAGIEYYALKDKVSGEKRRNLVEPFNALLLSVQAGENEMHLKTTGKNTNERRLF